jgi:hypothetical protein
MANRYTHAQFLKDIRLFELQGDGGFTKMHVKRGRSQLMQIHHPDKGGTKEKAQQINVTYERLSAWIEADKPDLKRREAERLRASRSLRIALGVLLLVPRFN